jgi:hypothetical protein
VGYSETDGGPILWKFGKKKGSEYLKVKVEDVCWPCTFAEEDYPEAAAYCPCRGQPGHGNSGFMHKVISANQRATLQKPPFLLQ